MLFHDKFIKESLSNFLHLDCLLDIDSKDIKEKFSSFVIKNTEENREKIFSHVPKELFTEFTGGEEKYLKITKADLLRYQKEQMANPIRAWGNDDEYNTRLITSLLFQATPKWHEYCTNLYEHGQDRYIHDQRAGGGRAKQFLNWMYDDEGYPGRLEEQNEYENLIPLCFPNPELLRLHFSYAGNGQYALVVSTSWKCSELYHKLYELNLLNKFTNQVDEKTNEARIAASFCVWQEAITKILGEQSLEKDLSLEQQKTHATSLIIEFVKNQAAKNKEEIQDTKQLQKKVTNFIRSINKKDNQGSQDLFIREPIVAIKNDEIKRQLDEKLESYSNLKKGAALKTGDCFFDSLAQGLNELKERGAIQYDSQFTVKSLREDCASYVEENRENKESWVYKKIVKDAGDGGYFVERKGLDGNAIIDPSTGKTVIEEKETFNKYLQDIENISEENGPPPIWGRLSIEGRMICEKYNVKIQVIDILEDIEDNQYIIEASGYITESEEGEGKNIVYMLNYKQHFVPLLSRIQQDITENQQVSKEEIFGNDKLAIQEAIKVLYQVRKNIAANKEFFDKFIDDKGVLQAEQYFRALTAHIDSEITFLETFKNNLTKEDLKIFLNQTCEKVHSDINELLLVHDFLLTDDLEQRDIVINFTRKEIKELCQYVSNIVNTYKVLLDNRSVLEIKNANDAEYKTIQEYIDNTKKLIPTLDIDHLISVIKEGRNSEDFKNEWLLNQLKLHPLSEHFKIENINEVKVGELWKIIESDNSNKEFNKSNFIKGLVEVVNSSSNGENKVHIEQSRWLAFKQWLYNVSYYVPLSSIWLSHVNPSKSRTGTKYKGKTLKEKLYTKNRVIQTSEFSKNIREALSLRTDDKEFVESKHEASWLIKEFRKKHRISGAKEKVLTYLGKNKILWYTLLTIFILFTSAAAIAGRVLSCLGIMPPVVVDRMINSLRGIFDGFVVMFGLDTIIDSIFILAVDLAGLVVRFVDYLLLFGLVSKTIRCLTKGIGKVVQGISSGFKALCETMRVYDLKGSFILLHDKITNSKQEEKCEIKKQKEEGCEVKEKIEKKKDIMLGQKHNIDNISSSIQKLWQESQAEGLKSNSERIKYVFNNLKSQIETDLFGRDIKFPKLSKNFSSINDLFKSATDWSFVRFQYEFHYLLSKYPEKLLAKTPKNDDKAEHEEKGVTAENDRMTIYDVMAAVLLQTKLVREEKRKCITSIGAKKVIKKFNDRNNREKVSLEVLDRKIAAIEWAVNTLESNDIDFAIKKAEPIFRTTKAHISAEVALRDYSKKLKELRNCGRQVSADELSAYEMIFTRYITDAHYMLSSIDQLTAKNHESNSLHQFRAAFSDNCTLLAPPSHGAKNAALILGIERGRVSLVSRVKEYTVDFVEEFQDPKVFAVAFAAYYVAVQVPGLLNVAHTITDVPEIMLDHAGLGMVYDHFLETDVGRALIEMVYQRGELLKDVWVLFNEFKDGIIGESELKKRWSKIKQEVKKTKSHCDHHEHGNAKERLASFINGLVHLILTIFCINLIRSLFHKIKTEYRTFPCYYQGELCVIDNPKPDEAQGNQNIIDNDMYNFSEVSKCLSNLAFVQNVLNTPHSVTACA